MKIEPKWIAEVTASIDALLGATAQRLRDLAANPPSHAEAIAAWNVLERRLELRGAVDPGELARGRHAGPHADAIAGVVRTLAGAVDAALDAGVNDPEDPIFRLRDLPRTFTISSGGWVGWRVALLDAQKTWVQPAPVGLPAGHPFRGFEAGRFGDEFGVMFSPPCVGGGNPRFVRLSTVKSGTAEYVRQQHEQELDAERRKLAEVKDRIRAADALERQAAQLRGSVMV